MEVTYYGIPGRGESIQMRSIDAAAVSAKAPHIADAHIIGHEVNNVRPLCVRDRRGQNGRTDKKDSDHRCTGTVAIRNRKVLLSVAAVVSHWLL